MGLTMQINNYQFKDLSSKSFQKVPYFKASISTTPHSLTANVIEELKTEVQRQIPKDSLNIESIHKRLDRFILGKIFKNTKLPEDGHVLEVTVDQQRLLGLYFDSIPAADKNNENFLLRSGSNYIFTTKTSVNGKKIIFPIPLRAKEKFGQDLKILNQTYRYGDLTEAEKITHLDAFTKRGRLKLGKNIPDLDQKQLAFNIPQVKDRPLKVLFLSLYPENNDYVFQSIGPNYIESYLKDNLGNRAVDVTHMETAIEFPSNIKAKIKEQNPDIIGISTKTNSHKQLSYWMDYLKKEHPEKLKVVGGQLANSSHMEILSEHPESIIIFDNGEVPFKRIADIIIGKDRPEHVGQIPNLAFNIDGKPVLTEFEDFNWITTAHSRPSDSNIKKVLDKNGVVGIRLSQGCWGNCTFCTHPGQWHGAKIDNIINVLKDWKEKFGLKGVFFTDDEIVNKDPKEAYQRLEELSDKLVESNLGITWTTALRADCVNWFDEKLISKMKKAGCVSMFLGIESGSNTQLLRYGKPAAGVAVNSEINERAIKLFADHGMKVGIGWIPFDPMMPTLRELKENIGFIERNNLLEQNIRLDTSLRVQRGSMYAKNLGNRNLGLLGELQPNMFHYDASYLDPRVGIIRDHVKEWIKDMEELDGKIHAVKFKLAVDPSQTEKFKPVLDIGEKLQTLTLEYMKELIDIFPENEKDKILDGIISQNDSIREAASLKLRDNTFMGQRIKELKNEVTAKRGKLIDITLKFSEKRTKILDEYQKINHSTTRVTSPGEYIEKKTTRCTGLPYEWEYSNRTNTRKGKEDDIAIIAPIIEQDGKKCLVFIETEKPPVMAEHGIKTIEFPAGLVGAINKTETTLEAAERKTNEEIGYEVLKLEKLTENCASSPGETSETNSIFIAKLGEKISDKLGDNDVIKNSHIVPIENAMEYLRERAKEGVVATSQTYATLSFIFEKIIKGVDII